MSSHSLLVCNDEVRLKTTRAAGLNGIDYVEAPDFTKPQTSTQLKVYLLGKAPADIREKNVVIKGGRRIRDIRVTDLNLCKTKSPSRDDCMIITVDKPGDFSTYTLCLVELDAEGGRTDRPFHGFDPRYACIDFSFVAGCPSDLDCEQKKICPPKPRQEPEINYLTKDYASFRQLILDRLALVMPDWKERHVPDLGITLVEMLAYVGDHLSYYQDAVATEAYLDTARQRISVRRHARLVDYQMHEGCNARAWVQVNVDNDLTVNPRDIFFITGKMLSLPDRLLTVESLLKQDIQGQQYLVFEPLTVASASVFFQERDIKNPAGLVLRIKHGQDEVSLSVKGQLDADATRWLQQFDGQGLPDVRLQQAIIQVFNQQLRNERESQRLPLRRKIEQAYHYDLTHYREADTPFQWCSAHNDIHFYTWGDKECCLLAGATEATLSDEWVAETDTVSLQDPKQQRGKKGKKGKGAQPGTPACLRQRQLQTLQISDVLLFEEMRSPTTNDVDDRDPAKRHAVRLTEVVFDVDPVGDKAIVHIRWANEDALPFPLCLSTISPNPKCEDAENISVAHGNIVLVDHGQSTHEALGFVREERKVSACQQKGLPSDITLIPALFRPSLKRAALTFSQPLVADTPAVASVIQDPRQALPQITLLETRNGVGRAWKPRLDLLGSQNDDRDFVVEMDDSGRAHLRFGDDELGELPKVLDELPKALDELPKVDTQFKADYRVGNGSTANVGAEMISHIVFRNSKPNGVNLSPRNPMPAQGGVKPEPVEEVKLYAPYAFRTNLERAITADDYATIVMRDFKAKIQRAAAQLRWMGGWYEVLVAIDPLGSIEARQDLLDEVAAHLRRYSRVRHDVKVAAAIYVPLEIELGINVSPQYLQGHVKAALLDAFGDHLLPDGRPAFFHPDNLTFGEGVYQSRIVAAAQAVTGVDCVVVSKLKRRFATSAQDVPQGGILKLGALEVARLDNDPSFPENGVIQFNMGGGR